MLATREKMNNYQLIHVQVATTGIECLIKQYGGSIHDNLHSLQYKLFDQSHANAKVN